MPIIRRPRLLSTVLVAISTLTACDAAERLRESVRPATPHERYAHALQQAGLDSTALGRDWISAAESVVRTPVSVALPFREAGYFAAHEARAIAYVVQLRDGQRLVAEVERQGTPLAMFLDVFRIDDDSARTPELVASADDSLPRVEHEARESGAYVVRVQPELLRSGAYVLSMHAEATLAFPVEGLGRRAVQSYFGAERDAGRRSHHGVDIFARRGTPVLAATAGFVRSTSPNELGGNVVWLSDARRSQSLYYAHLESHAVTAGQQVEVGDTLGFVGNSGNARSTSPHLHFGIYRRGRGPVDPLPFIDPPPTTAAKITADTSLLGELARTARSGARILAAPDEEATLVARIERATPLRIDGATAGWFRVRLPDGGAGYLSSRLTEQADDAVRRTRLAAGTVLRDRPAPNAAVLETVSRERVLPVIGVYANFALVETDRGRTGWVALD
jgi:murein DD-endopeptidase MepM/ murein hydrolase activator NlpD